MKLRFRHIFFPVLFALPLLATLVNCARESSPVGGIKDTIAPQIVWEKPRNHSGNISPQKITIKFDEFVSLEKIQDNCLISPLLEKNPTITAHKKKVTIDLSKQILNSNTTYSFNFSNAIKDVNEGNYLEQYSYAFSTGKIIDSLRIGGKVSYAKTHKIPEKAYVVMYDNLQDSAFKTLKPRYITQVNKDGKFSIENIASGTYKVFAIEDLNNDFIYNQPNEKIAFLDSLIVPFAEVFQDTVWYTHIDSAKLQVDSIQAHAIVKDSFSLQLKTRWSHQNLEFSLFENKQTDQLIKNSKRISKYAFSFGLQIPIIPENLKVNILNFSQESYSLELLPSLDSVVIWFRDTNLINAEDLQMLVTYPIKDNSTTLKTDTILISHTKELPQRLMCEFPKETSPKVFKGDTIFWELSRPIDIEHLDNIHLYSVRDTSGMKNSYGEYYTLDTSNQAIVKQQINLNQNAFVPKYYYDNQEILSYKIGLNRFALYFAKPFEPQDITITLQGLPNLTDWYVWDYDVTSNSLLCWITNVDAMRLKNPAIIVTYPIKGSYESKEIKKIDFNPGINPKDMYKTTKTVKLLAVVSDVQKNELNLDNVIEVICNNPIKSFTDSLITLIEVKDSLSTNIVVRCEISKISPRKLLIYHTAMAGKIYTLLIGKYAINDIYGNSSRLSEFTIKTQIIKSEKVYTSVPKTVFKMPENSRQYGVISNWKSNINYALSIPSATFVDQYGAISDSILYMVSCPKAENFGSLQVNLKNVHEPLVLILEQKDVKSPIKYTQYAKNDGLIPFKNLLPGDYILTCVFDKNNNGVWDSGDLDTKTNPEKITFYQKPIIIKANWDNTIEWSDLSK